MSWCQQRKTPESFGSTGMRKSKRRTYRLILNFYSARVSYRMLNSNSRIRKSSLNPYRSKIQSQIAYRSRDQTKDSNNDLQDTLTNLYAKNEVLERDLYTKSELLRTVEAQHHIYSRKLREDILKVNERLDHERYCKDIEYEDLRSYTRKLFESND